jgi:hypothetical protein
MGNLFETLGNMFDPKKQVENVNKPRTHLKKLTDNDMFGLILEGMEHKMN